MKLFFLAALLAPCISSKETHHFLHLVDDGKSFHQDIIYDRKDKTVLVIVGDVSAYKYFTPTMNFHDFNTGYVAFKDVNQQICSLSKTPIPKPTPELYRLGVSNETQRFTARYDPNPLTYPEVKEVAGSRIADFCKDYVTYFRTLIPYENNKRGVEGQQPTQPSQPCDHNCGICIIRSDLSTLNRNSLERINFG